MSDPQPTVVIHVVILHKKHKRDVITDVYFDKNTAKKLAEELNKKHEKESTWYTMEKHEIVDCQQFTVTPRQ